MTVGSSFISSPLSASPPRPPAPLPRQPTHTHTNTHTHTHTAPATMGSLMILDHSGWAPTLGLGACWFSSPEYSPPDIQMAYSCTSFCSNVTFPVRLFHDPSIQNKNFILQPHPTLIPCPSSLFYFSLFFVFILLSVSTSSSVISRKSGISVCSIHCCILSAWYIVSAQQIFVDWINGCIGLPKGKQHFWFYHEN